MGFGAPGGKIFCNLLRREGIELQRDVALVSFDNTPALHHAGLEIPAVAADRAGMVDRAIAAIRDPALGFPS